MTPARLLALGFGLGHTAAGLLAAAAPADVRPALGRDAPADARLRVLALLDAVPAAAVASAAVRGRPLRARLVAGIGSDLVRAVAVRRWGAVGVPLYSLGGAATAVALLPRVD